MGLDATAALLSSSGFPVRPQSWELLWHLALTMRMSQLIFLAYESAMINLSVCMETDSPRVYSNTSALLQKQLCTKNQRARILDSQ